MPICRMCGQDRRLVQAHVIPESFFRELRYDGQNPLIVSGVPGQFNKAAPKGVYDSQILCEDCEKKFDRLDDYGATIFLKRFDEFFEPVANGPAVAGYSSTSVDQHLLARFVLSVMWRASVSTQLFFRQVSLGPYELVAKASIEFPAEPLPSNIAIVLSRWTTPEAVGWKAHALLDPSPSRFGVAKCYRLYFGAIVALVRVGREPLPVELERCALGRSDQLVVVLRDFAKSKDMAVLRKTAQTAHRRQLLAHDRRGKRSN